jgi:hypothetical protein
MTVRVPGSRDGAKTATGGVSFDATVEGDEMRYEVRDPKSGATWRFRSITAAAGFMRDHPNTHVHRLSTEPEFDVDGDGQG